MYDRSCRLHFLHDRIDLNLACVKAVKVTDSGFFRANRRESCRKETMGRKSWWRQQMGKLSA